LAGAQPGHLVEPPPRGEGLARGGAGRGERPGHLEHCHRQQRGKGQYRGGQRAGTQSGAAGQHRGYGAGGGQIGAELAGPFAGGPAAARRIGGAKRSPARRADAGFAP
jgi:hypothetical protein